MHYINIINNITVIIITIITSIQLQYFSSLCLIYMYSDSIYSKVSFIYIVLFTIQIVLKQIYSDNRKIMFCKRRK